MVVSRARGQHAGLSRDAILEAAVRLVDRQGLAALSMRQLGAELGVEAMALYHHIPNKSALLDGMVERVVAEASPPDFDGSSWSEGLRDYARSLLRALEAHPDLVPLFMSRPAMTPRNLRAMEAMLGALCAAGFEPRRALDVVYSLTGFVLGHVAVQRQIEEAGPGGGADSAARLSGVPADVHPLLSRAARDDRPSGTASRFDFALDALLAGFDAARGV
ncbi:TetR/AcrR family transcriptional regulator C-terminal domain-containing protein [Streptomyces halstedii]|uniref:TetR/AcrR family transcriptional regulator C-terminal domain-containing protein n=1 Tax=Streptomyces halstedii TaxID=1944 RepID=UPI00345F9240